MELHEKVDFITIMNTFAVTLDKEITTEKIDFYFEYLKDFDINIIRNACKEIIKDREVRSIPTIGEIRKEAIFIKHEKKTLKEKPVYCEYCSGCGFVTVQDSDGYETAYRCNCLNGRKISSEFMSYKEAMVKYSLPPLEQKNDNDYQIITHEEIVADPSKFYNGIKVEYTCKNCQKKYYVTYHNKVNGQWIIECHAEQSGGLCLCEPCYVEEGRKRGLWK